MSLQISGKTLAVTTEHVTPAGGTPFDSTTITLHTGGKFTEQVRVGRDFQGELPKEGQDVVLDVYVSAYATRGGAGYRFTATSRVGAPAARVPAGV